VRPSDSRDLRIDQPPDGPTNSRKRLKAGFWASIVAPTGTPADLVDKLNLSINEILRSSVLVASLAKFNAKPKMRSSQDFAKFWLAETEKWTDITASVGFKAD
jgi:tripartite-type tricarboxylate transporter receptor subunit TctC